MEQTACSVEYFKQRFKELYAGANYEAASEAIARLCHSYYKANLESGEDNDSAFKNAKKSLIPLFVDMHLLPDDVTNTCGKRIGHYYSLLCKNV